MSFLSTLDDSFAAPWSFEGILVERAACRARSASDDVKLYRLILFKHLSAATPFCTNLCLSVMASFGGATVDTHTMDVNYWWLHWWIWIDHPFADVWCFHWFLLFFLTYIWQTCHTGTEAQNVTMFSFRTRTSKIHENLYCWTHLLYNMLFIIRLFTFLMLKYQQLTKGHMTGHLDTICCGLPSTVVVNDHWMLLLKSSTFMT